jgi:hypothetical protein
VAAAAGGGAVIWLALDVMACCAMAIFLAAWLLALALFYAAASVWYLFSPRPDELPRAAAR